MPFTFSHPAAILLIGRKNNLSFTGLIIGSLTPDFEYFFRMKIKSEFSHTIFDGIYFDLPVGLILCFLYHSILKISLIQNSPSFIQKKFRPSLKFNWNKYFVENYFRVICSLIIGIYSHILWDSLTHQNAYFVLLFGFDNEFLNIPIYKFNQHVSTVFGCAYVFYFIYKMKDFDIQVVVPNLRYWLLVAILLVSFMAVRFYSGLKYYEIGNLIVNFISASLFSILTASVVTPKNKIA